MGLVKVSRNPKNHVLFTHFNLGLKERCLYVSSNLHCFCSNLIFFSACLSELVRFSTWKKSQVNYRPLHVMMAETCQKEVCKL